MNNYKQPGDVLSLTAPGGGVVSGAPLLIGGLLVVPAATVAATLPFEGKVNGVFELAKTSAQAWTEGQKLYWDAGNARADSDSTVGPLIGVATVVAANPSSTGMVRLNGSTPSTAEGPQGSIVALTDSTGLSGTHDDTLAATAALVVLTDNTGDSGTHDDTVADQQTAAAPVAPTNYAAVVNMTNPVTKTEGEAVSAALATLEDETTAIGVVVAALRTDNVVASQNTSDLAQKMIEVTNQMAVTNQNISDTAQKVLEIRTALIAAGILAA